MVVVLIMPSCKAGKRAQRSKAKAEVENKSQNSDHVRTKYAEYLATDPANIKNVRLYEFIDDWYGVPYRYGGIDRQGVDCSGFVQQLYTQVYQRTVPRTTSEMAKQVKSVSKGKLQEGDIVFFDISGKKNAHMGVYLQNDRFVHASSSKGVIISTLNNPYYQRAYSKGGKI